MRAHSGRTFSQVASAGLSAAVLHLLLVQPNHPRAMAWDALLLFPLELPAILLGLMACGQSRAGYVLRGIITAALSVIFVVKTADFISFTALSRGFNPVTDLFLIGAFVNLLTGSLGPVLTVLAVLGGVLASVGVAGLTWWATGIWSRFDLPRAGVRSAGLAALLCAAIGLAEIGHVMGKWRLPANPPGAAFTARLGVERLLLIRNTRADLRRFRAAAAEDPMSGRDGLLHMIDRDVLIVFVESYGRASLETPLYATLHRDTLQGYADRLTDEGVALRSGFLTAPTRGGQSWLSHATFANGLWVNNQVSYAATLSSGRKSLFHHAAESGFRTAAVMPQITLDWPESARMGFQDIFVAADMGYRGLPMNWVTMPDQFTLAALDRLLRGGDDPRRLMAQVVLVSSHAPWVPVPEILPWDAVGDGTVYNALAASQDPPEVIWRDHDRVRAQYALAVDYALQAVFEYALRHAKNPPLLVIIGDHQAAEFVALDDRAEVPFHVVGPAHLVDLLSPVAPTRGLLPKADDPVIAMDSMRDVLLNSFSSAPYQELGN